MTEPSLELQKMIRARLVAAIGVTTLVPAKNIFDASERPERFPRIVFGKAFTGYGDNFEAFYDRALMDIQVWVDTGSISYVYPIGAAIRTALSVGPWAVAGFKCVNFKFTTFRTVRYPGTSHVQGILSAEAILQEAA